MLFSNKKASNFAPLVTTGIVLFNLIIFILVSAFASDDTHIGTSNDIYSSIDEVNTTYDILDVSKPSFFDKFFLVIFDLPWWIQVFIFFVNVILIPITILAWVRGL